jgi:hypothetical protein
MERKRKWFEGTEAQANDNNNNNKKKPEKEDDQRKNPKDKNNPKTDSTEMTQKTAAICKERMKDEKSQVTQTIKCDNNPTGKAPIKENDVIEEPVNQYDQRKEQKEIGCCATEVKKSVNNNNNNTLKSSTPVSRETSQSTLKEVRKQLKDNKIKDSTKTGAAKVNREKDVIRCNKTQATVTSLHPDAQCACSEVHVSKKTPQAPEEKVKKSGGADSKGDSSHKDTKTKEKKNNQEKQPCIEETCC